MEKKPGKCHTDNISKVAVKVLKENPLSDIFTTVSSDTKQLNYVCLRFQAE